MIFTKALYLGIKGKQLLYKFDKRRSDIVDVGKAYVLVVAVVEDGLRAVEADVHLDHFVVAVKNKLEAWRRYTRSLFLAGTTCDRKNAS